MSDTLPQKRAGQATKEELAAEVTSRLDADLYGYFGAIYREESAAFQQCVAANQSRPNAVLILDTPGGDPDAAYQMARVLQASYAQGSVAILVPGVCKSAGTLLAVGAKEIIMADGAELGPLDVQLTKPDTLGELQSVLTPTQALSALSAEAFQCFEKFFLGILRRSNYAITAKTAAMIAARMTAGLYKPIYAQIDPMRFGESQRAKLIGIHYGRLLNEWAENLKGDSALADLVQGYPSHGFVIDRREAGQLFKRLRQPTDSEDDLARRLLKDYDLSPSRGSHAQIEFLSPTVEGSHPGDGVRGDPPAAGKRPAKAGRSPARDGTRRRRSAAGGEPSANGKPAG